MAKMKDDLEDKKRFADKELEAIEPKGDRSVQTGEYRFNEKRHLHELLVDGEWKPLTGCTTILSIIAKPALIQWSANTAVEYIKNKIDEVTYNVDIWNYRPKMEEALPRILLEAKTAHVRKKEEAGQKGTDVHAEVEIIVADVIKRNNGVIAEGLRHHNPQVQDFINWATDYKVKFLESEKTLYSKSLFLGGIVDLVCEIDGEIYIADIKTGSGIYPEHFAQMAGYELMLKEMGFDRPVKGHIVLNLKKDGTFQEKRSISVEDAKDFFVACVQVYRLQEKFKNQII